MGDYAGLGAPDLLIASRHDRRPTELADLRGRRLVICAESGEERRLAEARVKLLTGEKRIKGRGMRQDFIEFDATHKFLLMSNHRPRIRGGDLGIWRRIRLIPFTETIGDAEKDPELPQKLEAQLAGIVRWLVAGAVMWATEGLGGILNHQPVIWVKPVAVFGRMFWHQRHEPCLMGWVKGSMPPFARDQSLEHGTVWEVNWEGKSRIIGNEHPTQKPVEIFARPIRRHARPGDICYEPFSGSGSQLVAAEQLGRRCYAMELEPTFVDVAVRRWERLTGKKGRGGRCEPAMRAGRSPPAPRRR